MMNKKLSGYLEAGGETVVVLAAALWITRLDFVPYLFALGVLVFAIGRLAVQKYIESDSLTVRRLLRQRVTGVVLLLLSSVAMFLPPGFYGYMFGLNLFVRPSLWLIFFVVFVVIEVYTAFRLSNELKK